MIQYYNKETKIKNNSLVIVGKESDISNNINKNWFKFIDNYDDIIKNKNLILNLISTNPHIYTRLPYDLKNDNDILMQYLCFNNIHIYRDINNKVASNYYFMIKLINIIKFDTTRIETVLSNYLNFCGIKMYIKFLYLLICILKNEEIKNGTKYTGLYSNHLSYTKSFLPIFGEEGLGYPMFLRKILNRKYKIEDYLFYNKLINIGNSLFLEKEDFDLTIKYYQ